MQAFPSWAWIIFGAGFFALLAADLFTSRNVQDRSRKWPIIWSIIWIFAGLAFNVFVWVVAGGEAAQEYLAAYLIEKSLSLDNLFVFLVIFQSLNIPKGNQRTALIWGIFGALAFRGIFIFVGASALARWGWIEYLFGAILFVAAFHAFRKDPAREKDSKAVAWLSRHLPVTRQTDTRAFLVRQDGQWMATPLLIAVLALEAIDIMFAVDSIPAAFAVTKRTFLIYSSNAFAILGLRSLYLVLARTIAELRYLHYGLAGVLAFAGLKLIVGPWIEIPPLASVGVIAVLIGASIWASVRARREKA